jgi:flagellar hook-associated protein 3 FlgL
MRVNPNIVPDVLAGIYATQSQEQEALLQLSTGKRVNVPSDNPLAAALMIGNQDQSSRTDQYLQNIDSLTAQMQTADSALSSVVTALNQAISLGVEGGTGTSTTANRQEIASNIQGIQAQILQLANTEVGGSFLFAGTNTTSTPYELDSTSASGVVYKGNNGTNTVGIAQGLNVQTNLPGDQIFQNSNGDVFGSLQALLTALQSGTSTDIQNATTSLRDAYNNVTAQRVFYGNVENQLNSTQTFLNQEQVNLKSQENDLIGADQTKAATDLTQATTAHDAVLAAAAKMLPTSLLDYLK